MKKLITGGSGLVGSAFNSGIKINSKQFNLTSEEETKLLFEDVRPDIVIHTAARVGGVGANIKYPATFFLENMKMNINIIECARKYGVKKLACFLSTCVFPDKVDYPLEEHKIQLGPPHDSNFAYAYAKRMAEIQIQAYNKQFGTKYFSIIPTNVYGPNDNYSLEFGHVIPMLIHKCYLAKKNNTDFEVWGSGRPLREFIYSKDLANIVDLLLERYDGTDPVIVSTSKEYSINDIVNMIIEYMEFDGKVVWLSDKPDGQYRKPSSNKRLLNIIGDYEFTPLEIGLKETIDWFVANYNIARK